VGGLAEIVNNNESGFIVPPCNPDATAEALEKLVLDKGLRDKFGKRGREIVREKYFWDDNVNLMMDIYDKVLAVNKN